MNLKATLLAATLAIFAAAAPVCYADQQADAKAQAQAAKDNDDAARKPVKKHSHMEEKSSMPMPEHASGMEKHDGMKPMDMHDHSKDRH